VGKRDRDERNERRTKRKGRGLTKKNARIVKIEFHKVKERDISSLGGVPFIVPVKARMPLVQQWWGNYQMRSPTKANKLTAVYVFHWHLRLLFPKERGILIAYPSSLVNLDREVYYTSKRYRALARRVIARDQGRCRLCNTGRPLNVHHRNYSYWGDESPDELTTLCEKCHELFHDHRRIENNGLFYVWTKPSKTRGRALPWGYTDSIAGARRERDRYW
jgi:hypothetical protein